MPYKLPRRNTVDVIRNIAIIDMHRRQKMSFAEIASFPDMPSRQQCSNIFKSWRKVNYKDLTPTQVLIIEKENI